VVSKKVARTAPARNRTRRRTYDALTRTTAAARFSAIVYVKRGGTALNFSQLTAELGTHFR
jgi:ribonuclease P protein component